MIVKQLNTNYERAWNIKDYSYIITDSYLFGKAKLQSFKIS